jgi:hypothetical protein
MNNIIGLIYRFIAFSWFFIFVNVIITNIISLNCFGALGGLLSFTFVVVG